MTPALWIALGVGVVGSGGLGVLVGAVLTHRRETKRDRASAVMQHAHMVQQHLAEQQVHSARQGEQIARQGEQIERLWQARRDDARVIRAQGDHIDVLEDHIWRRVGPPPPARPQTA